KLTSVEWMLDCLFHPEQSIDVPCFVLDTYEVADAIGVPRGSKGKRDHWTYLELAPGGEQLEKVVVRLSKDPVKREAKNRDAIEEQLRQLYEKMSEFVKLASFFDFARDDYPVGEDADARALFGGADHVSFAGFIEQAPALSRELRLLRDPKSDVDAARRQSELA